MCSPVLAAPRVDLAEVELTEEEVKMLTVNIIQEAGLRADIQGVCLKMGLYTYTILYPKTAISMGYQKKEMWSTNSSILEAIFRHDSMCRRFVVSSCFHG